MKELDTIQFSPDHLRNAALLPEVKQELEWQGEDGLQSLGDGLAMSVVNKAQNDVVVASYGCRKIWNGVASVWIVPTLYLLAVPPRAVVEEARIALQNFWDTYGLHRMHISVWSGNPKGVKFARALGFRTECQMPGYAPDGSGYTLLSITERPTTPAEESAAATEPVTEGAVDGS